MEGQLSTAPGLGTVSVLLKARGALGGNCGDPPNVPPDITSNSHLDMQAPASLWKLIGTPEGDVENADIEVKEWRDQGELYMKAHVARAAAAAQEGMGASVLMVRALFQRFDADGDGRMQREDMNALLTATHTAGSPPPQLLDEEAWAELLKDTRSHPKRGLAVKGLMTLYMMPEEDCEADCRLVFGDDWERLPPGGVPIPAELAGTCWREAQEEAVYNERDAKGDPDPDEELDPKTEESDSYSADEAAPEGMAFDAGARLDRPFYPEPFPDPAYTDPQELREPPLPLRRWLYEETRVYPTDDVWGSKLLEDCAPKPIHGRAWYDLDWGEYDYRMARDFLFQHSLQMDAKQRFPKNPGTITVDEQEWRDENPEEAAAADAKNQPDPGPMYDAHTTIKQEPDPPTMYGVTWNEMIDRTAPARMEVPDSFVTGPCDRHRAAGPLPKEGEEDAVPSGEKGDWIDLESEANGMPILPEGCKWEDVAPIDISGIPRSTMAAMFSKGLNPNLPCDREDFREPLPFNYDGHPWVFRRPDTPELCLAGLQDPWDPSSPPSFDKWRGEGGWISKLGLRGEEGKQRARLCFKLLMVGLDGGGKTSLLFCWKANLALGNTELDVMPTIATFNAEELAYKDTVLVVWDQGGPDKLRPCMRPTADPETVDAIVYVVDAARFKTNAEYREAARVELWRHLEGDLITKDVLDADLELDDALRQESYGGTAMGQDADDEAGERPPLKKQFPPLLNREGLELEAPADAGLWLRHVTKVLVLANKCEAEDRASLEELRAGLHLDDIHTTRILGDDEHESPVVVMPHHPEVPRLCRLQACSAVTGHGVLDGLEWLYQNLDGFPPKSL